MLKLKVAEIMQNLFASQILGEKINWSYMIDPSWLKYNDQ